jgi:hypothetical protein
MPLGGLSGWADEAKERVQKLATLKDDWNGHRAKAPSQLAIDNAIRFIGAIGSGSLKPSRVGSSGMGGVAMVFVNGSREVGIEFYNNGKAHALFSDDSTDDMFTAPVVLDGNGAFDFLVELQEHFNAD